MSSLPFKFSFLVIFSHVTFFSAAFATWAFSAPKKVASNLISLFPPVLKSKLFSKGTFIKFSSFLENSTRNSEKLFDKFDSVPPRLLLSKFTVKLCRSKFAFSSKSYFQLSLQHTNALLTHVACRALINIFRLKSPSPPSSGFAYNLFFAMLRPCVTKLSILLLISDSSISLGVRMVAT